jgi:hypothetical protein
VHQNPLLGLFGVALVCLTQAMIFPFVKRWDYSAGQFLVFRGAVSALIAGAVVVLTGGKFGSLSVPTLAVMLTFGVAAVALYKAAKAWDVKLVITMIASTPIVNFLVAFLSGEKIAVEAFASFVLLLAGLVIALRLWEVKGAESRAGIAWSLLGILANGLYYEALDWVPTDASVDTTEAFFSAMPLAFWQAAGVSVVGLLMSMRDDWKPVAKVDTVLKLTIWAFLAGFLYFVGNIFAVNGMPTEVASVLLQLEIPAVIVASQLLLPENLKGKSFSATQWVGVSVALLAGAYLGITLKS